MGESGEEPRRRALTQSKVFFLGCVISATVSLAWFLTTILSTTNLQNQNLQERHRPSQEPTRVDPQPRADSSTRDSQAIHYEATVVNAWTAEPLPFYRFHLNDPSTGGSEILTTDERGRFSSYHRYIAPAERLEICPIDHPLSETNQCQPLSIRTIQKVEEVGPDIIPLAVGPTYRLRLTGSEEVPFDLLRASFRSLPTRNASSPEKAQKSWGTRFRRLTQLETPLTGFPARAWVRFANIGFYSSKSNSLNPVLLEVGTRDGMWYGATAAPRSYGEVPGPLSIELEALTVLKGIVIDEDGREAAQATVQLYPQSTDPAPVRNLKSSIRETTDAQGRFRIPFLDPGPYLVSAIPPRFSTDPKGELDTTLVHITLVAGVEERVELTLRARAPLVTRAIEGRITSATGRFRGSVRMNLQLLGPSSKRRSGKRRSTPVSWTRSTDGSWVGGFRFEGVPAHEWGIVSPTSLKNFAWRPEQIEVSPTQTELEFQCQDHVETASFGFVVRDAGTGEVLPRFSLTWSSRRDRSPAGSALRPVGRRGGGLRNLDGKGWSGAKGRCRPHEAVIRDLPVSREFEWTIRVSGYEPTSGHRYDFRFDPEYESMLVAEVFLDRSLD